MIMSERLPCDHDDDTYPMQNTFGVKVFQTTENLASERLRDLLVETTVFPETARNRATWYVFQKAVGRNVRHGSRLDMTAILRTCSRKWVSPRNQDTTRCWDGRGAIRVQLPG